MNVRIAALVLACVALAPTALAATGPFRGVVRQGETDVHRYDNNPNNDPCIQITTTYTVTLTYTPPTDTLTLTVGGQSVTGSNGVATLSFEGNWCTAFDILVTGTDVENVARYTVTVSRGGGAPI